MVSLFLMAVVGRAVVEIYDAQKYYRTGNCQLPKRYRQLSYWIVVVLSALAAGCIALMLPTINPDYAKPAYAFVIGVTGEKVVVKLKNLAPVLLRHFLSDE